MCSPSLESGRCDEAVQIMLVHDCVTTCIAKCVGQTDVSKLEEFGESCEISETSIPVLDLALDGVSGQIHGSCRATTSLTNEGFAGSTGAS